MNFGAKINISQILSLSQKEFRPLQPQNLKADSELKIY